MNFPSTSRLLLQSTRLPTCCAQRRFAHKLVEVELIENVPNLGMRGDRLIVSPGRARNQLLPRVQALYVVNGVAISPLRAMVRKEQARVSGRVLRPANMVELEEVLEIVEDPLAQAKEAESVLLTAISLLPLLSFSRRTQSSPGSKEIFGSVTSTDILASMREYGVVVDESNGAVKEGEGVDRGRIKALGRFDYTVQLKALGETVDVRVEVVRGE